MNNKLVEGLEAAAIKELESLSEGRLELLSAEAQEVFREAFVAGFLSGAGFLAKQLASTWPKQ